MHTHYQAQLNSGIKNNGTGVEARVSLSFCVGEEEEEEKHCVHRPSAYNLLFITIEI